MTARQIDRTSLATLKSKVHNLVEYGRLGDALDEIRKFVEFIVQDPRSVAKVFASKDIDKLCRFVGEAAATAEGVSSYPQKMRSGTVILITELVKAGGHVELIKDIIRLKLFDGPVCILITDIIDRVDHAVITNFLQTYKIPVEVSTGRSSDERLKWIIKRLRELTPSTLVLLTYNQDSVGVSAAHSRVADKVVFIHHADHHLALGVTCENFIHVDPHNLGFFQCRHELGIKNNYYWPLTVNCKFLEPRSNSFLAQGNLVTCSSGRPEKFEPNFYLYDYIKLIPRLLAVTKGRHIHIGILSADVQARLHHELAAVGVEPACFIHVSWVSSVAQALVDYNVDLYISSFPLGGGKTTVEAMAAGTPLLMHQNYNSRFLGAVDLAYPDAWVWRSESELIDIISTINLTDLERHSHLAKAHYKKYHSEKVLVDLANFLNFPKITEIPKLKEYSDNPLQTLLDENARDNAMNNQKKIYPSEHEIYKLKDDYSKLEHEYSREIKSLKNKCLSVRYLVRQLLKQLLIRLSNYFK